MSGEVKDNAALGRYELVVDGATAFAAYRMEEGRRVFTHTEVPESMAGKGVGSALARGALEDARAKGMTVVPLCSFIAGYIERHPDYRDLVAGP